MLHYTLSVRWAEAILTLDHSLKSLHMHRFSRFIYGAHEHGKIEISERCVETFARGASYFIEGCVRNKRIPR